jgi:arylsulfatase A-like enzyme
MMQRFGKVAGTGVGALLLSCMAAAPVMAQAEIDRTVLPLPIPAFAGTIGETYLDSVEAWPTLPTAPEGAPNVVVILLDDVGYGQVSTFGGPVPTPALDALAADGLRYTAFHTTAICGPSRAALITGQNHHQAGSGFLAEWATGFPSYNNMIPPTTATMGEILRDNGFTTSWFGKNHNTPDWESSVVGPFDRWPTGMGFDYFYGFIGGETNQFYPTIFENTRPAEPATTPAEGYHFLTDMTDRAINWMSYTQSVAPDKPYLLYFAPGAVHAPHHAPAEWRDMFAGQFDAGWDEIRTQTFERQLHLGVIPEGTELTPRPEWLEAWETLTPDERRLNARLMENFAGYLAFTDHEVGRLIDAIHASPDGDNTLIIYIVGDNGASSEGGPTGTVNEVAALSGFPATTESMLEHFDEIGGPTTEPHYPMGWAWAGNAPFQWVKQVASHLGGTRNPMVISWPARITDTGGIRPQFTHLIDVLPTILDATSLPQPVMVNGTEQNPMDGVSFLSTFESADAPEVRTRQYFEVFSNRAIYDNGWMASAQHTFPWRQDFAPGNWENDRWELYNLAEDYSQANDLAATEPERLAAMQALFDEEALRNNVYPLDDRGTGRLVTPKPTPADPNRTSFTYYAGAVRLAETAAPNTKNRSHTITADLVIPDGGGEGVILAEGGISAGFVLYMQDGRLFYEYNWLDEERTTIASADVLPAGPAIVQFVFDYDGGGVGMGGLGSLYVNGEQVAQGRIAQTVPARFGTDTFGVGIDTGAPVSYAYDAPFVFSGTINRVDIELGSPD